MMFSHVTVGVTDVPRAFAFYDAVLGTLGAARTFTGDTVAGWRVQPDGAAFYAGTPFDGGPPAPGNGLMTAFRARDRAMVDAVHAAALRHGGACEGPPGERPQYALDYYGAYFRDPDGNKLHVVHRMAWGSVQP